MRAKVENYAGLEKDLTTGVVINTNHSAYEQAIERARKAQEEKDRIDRLEKDVGDMKEMLKQILQRVS